MKDFLESNKYCLTAAGLETFLIYNQGVFLNEFAAFELILTKSGREALKKFYTPYLELAAAKKIPFIFETPTWRANCDWGMKLGYTINQLISININAVGFICEIIKEVDLKGDTVLSGCVGPRRDGYEIQNAMSIKEAYKYHHDQIQAFSIVDVDLISAMTINYTEEAIGIALAAKKNNLPVVISFTVELNGMLPSGQSLEESIIEVDNKTNNYPSYYMINSAQPNHLITTMSNKKDWVHRIKGVRANTNTKSFLALDKKKDKYHLASKYDELFKILPNLKVLGGFYSTDINHIEEVCNLLVE